MALEAKCIASDILLKHSETSNVETEAWAVFFCIIYWRARSRFPDYICKQVSETR